MECTSWSKLYDGSKYKLTRRSGHSSEGDGRAGHEPQPARGCQVPIGAYAELQGDELWLRGLVGSIDGQRILRAEIRGPVSDAETLGKVTRSAHRTGRRQTACRDQPS